MRVLVTGSRGLLGYYLCQELTESGHSVVGYDILEGRDVRRSVELAHAAAQVDAVVHLASPSSSILFDADEDSCWHDTLEPLRVLLESAPGRLIVPSSGTVYGDRAADPREGDPLPHVRSLYAMAKRESERLALHARSSGRDVAMPRIFTGYGGHESHKRGFDSPPFAMTSSALKGDVFQIYGDGSQARDFVHARDIARAMTLMLQAVECPPIVNIGTGGSVTMNELVRVVGAVAGRTLTVDHVERPQSYVSTTCADIGLARRALGYQPMVSLELGIAEIVETLALDHAAAT